MQKQKLLKIGNPLEKETNIGALVSKPHLEKVKSYIDIAEEEGGTILCGGNYVTVDGFENGYYLEPTIIEIKDANCRLNQEEIFGPVVTIMPFDSDEEALALANGVRYGLSSTSLDQ